MDEDAGRMRLVLAAESKARREEEQLELAEKNAEMCGASPNLQSYTNRHSVWQLLHAHFSKPRTPVELATHSSLCRLPWLSYAFPPLDLASPPVQARDDQAYACRLPHP